MVTGAQTEADIIIIIIIIIVIKKSIHSLTIELQITRGETFLTFYLSFLIY